MKWEVADIKFEEATMSIPPLLHLLLKRGKDTYKIETLSGKEAKRYRNLKAGDEYEAE